MWSQYSNRTLLLMCWHLPARVGLLPYGSVETAWHRTWWCHWLVEPAGGRLIGQSPVCQWGWERERHRERGKAVVRMKAICLWSSTAALMNQWPSQHLCIWVSDVTPDSFQSTGSLFRFIWLPSSSGFFLLLTLKKHRLIGPVCTFLIFFSFLLYREWGLAVDAAALLPFQGGKRIWKWKLLKASQSLVLTWRSYVKSLADSLRSLQGPEHQSRVGNNLHASVKKITPPDVYLIGSRQLSQTVVEWSSHIIAVRVNTLAEVHRFFFFFLNNFLLHQNKKRTQVVGFDKHARLQVMRQIY